MGLSEILCYKMQSQTAESRWYNQYQYLRKYIATITQVLSLEEKELDWLARHLGHDIRTHREYYRLHESTIEIAKISKLLLDVDCGKAGSLKGKSLDGITIDGEL
jgi:hypothetical protein